MYNKFEAWLDEVLNSQLPKEIAAFNFNLYDDGDNNWSIELVGTLSFDENNDNWACDEVFATRENPFSWNEAAGWEDILNKAIDLIKAYLEKGNHAKMLKNAMGVGAGFVDGDLVIVHTKKQGGFLKRLLGRI